MHELDVLTYHFCMLCCKLCTISYLSCKMKHCYLLVILIGVSVSVSNLQSSCKTPNNETATCLPLQQCEILMNSLLAKSRTTQQTEFLQQSQCDPINKTVSVCCGSVNDFQSDFNEQKKRQLLPPKGKCGIQGATSRVVGGEATDLYEFPWMALLGYQKLGRSFRFDCGGLLINSRYVVTAAHCIHEDALKNTGPLVTVRLGEYDLRQPIDCLPDSGCNEPPVDVSIEEIIPHESYKHQEPNRYHDVGILRLAKDVSFTSFIKPICLAITETEYTSVGDRAYVGGWGVQFVENGTRSFVKLKLNVPIFDQKQCSAIFRQSGVYLSPRQICAGGERGKDSCQGDSGGPLMSTVPGNSDIWFAEGIVSFGVRCGTAGWPGIYTNITDYLDWIVDKMRM